MRVKYTTDQEEVLVGGANSVGSERRWKGRVKSWRRQLGWLKKAKNKWEKKNQGKREGEAAPMTFGR